MYIIHVIDDVQLPNHAEFAETNKVTRKNSTNQHKNNICAIKYKRARNGLYVKTYKDIYIDDITLWLLPVEQSSHSFAQRQEI